MIFLQLEIYTVATKPRFHSVYSLKEYSLHIVDRIHDTFAIGYILINFVKKANFEQISNKTLTRNLCFNNKFFRVLSKQRSQLWQ